MGQNKLTMSEWTTGLTVFVVVIAVIVGIFAAVAALQWWVVTISALAVPVIIAVCMVAVIISGYRNFSGGRGAPD
jgi:ribose/xylose/arabinose/galactoside ABC-type transport system permease subunit